MKFLPDCLELLALFGKFIILVSLILEFTKRKFVLLHLTCNFPLCCRPEHLELEAQARECMLFGVEPKGIFEFVL